MAEGSPDAVSDSPDCAGDGSWRRKQKDFVLQAKPPRLQAMHYEILWYFSVHFADTLVVLSNLIVRRMKALREKADLPQSLRAPCTVSQAKTTVACLLRFPHPIMTALKSAVHRA